MAAYQELESKKYLSDRVENEHRRDIVKQKFVNEVWNLTAIYSLVFVAGFFLLQFTGFSIADFFQAGVNAVVDWSINS